MSQETALPDYEAAESRLETINSVEITDPGLLEFWNRIQGISDNLKAGLLEDLFTKTRAQIGAVHPDYLIQVARMLLHHDSPKYPFENRARILAAFANGENLDAQREIAVRNKQAKSAIESTLQ